MEEHLQNVTALLMFARDNVRIDDDGDALADDHRDDIVFAAIETTRMPMLVTDPRRPDNPIVFTNRAFVAMTGYQQAELIGRNCRFLQGDATDPAAIAEIRQAIAGQRECSVEILNYRKDGSTFWNALFVSPVFNKSGALVYYFASQLDVSRRRDAEDALAQAQKMEALGQLTGGIAHDFNNLLHVMNGHVDLLKLQASRDAAFPQKALRGIQMIGSAVEKGSRLTQQLLAFSRKQNLRGRVINLNASVEAMSEMARSTLGAEIRLEFDFAPHLPNCELDPTQLEVAVLNLLVNARDAMTSGGTIHVSTSRIDLGDDEAAHSGLEPGAYVTIAVTDEGSGIPPELIDRVMDPFFTTKEEGKGTGLGLSTVYGFTKQSRGTARIRSEVGRGTTVRLYFPVSGADVQATSPVVATDVGIGGSERILVVEDRREVGELACAMLRQLGYTATLVGDAGAALAHLTSVEADGLPHLVFSDVVMPGGMNGYALAKRVRDEAPTIDILLTTGFDRDFMDIEGKEARHFEVIRKPYRLSDLAKRIRGILDGPTGYRRRS